MEWSHFKEFVEYATGVSRESLHVFLGVCLQFGVAVALRIPVSRWWPWCLVLGFAAANEFFDVVLEYWNLPAQQFGESAKDIMLTMFVPTLILLAARYMPWLFQQSAREVAQQVEDTAQP